MVVLTSFFAPGRGWAQSLSVPLRRAAHFGLLSGGSLTTDSTAVPVRGKVGAGGGIGLQVAATDSLLSNGSGSVVSALADVQAVISHAQALALPAMLPAAMTVGGLYEMAGNYVLDTASALTLPGDTATRYVIRVTGNLLVKSHGGARLRGAVRPEHVVWVIAGSLMCQPYASLPGIVLVAGSTTITGVQHGAQALLMTGAISFSNQDATLGRGAYTAPAVLSLPPDAFVIPNPPLCTGLTGENFLLNGNLENFVRINMQPGRSDVHYWDAASGTPDYFHTLSPPPGNRTPPSVGVPVNHFGTQGVHWPGVDQAYMGLYPYAEVLGNVGDYHDYIHQSFRESRLEAGRWYYGEFYVSRAEASNTTVTELAMFVAPEDAPRRWFERRAAPNAPVVNPLALLRLVPPGGSYLSAPLAVPQIRYKELPSLSSTTAWVRVSGCFQATGTEKCVLIGSFTPQSGNATAKAYYYVDDVSLTAFPRAAASESRIVCGTQITLGTDDCPLPAGAKAVYWWTDDVGSPPTPFNTTPAYTVSVTQTTTFTLHTRVELSNSGGQVRVVTSTVTVRVEPNLCRQECIGPAVTYFSNQKIYGSYEFEAGQMYAITNSFEVMPDTIVKVKTGAVLLLLLPVGVRIDVAPDAVFHLESGTLTNACGELWDGIYVASGGDFYATAGPTGRRAEISFAADGVVLSDDPAATQPPPMRIEYTDFRHNWRHLTWRMAPSTPRTGSYLRHCTLDTDPLLLEEAIGTGRQYNALWSVRLSGDLRHVPIVHNEFGRAWTGLFATEDVYLGSPLLHTLAHNTFSSNWLAGVWAGGSLNSLYCEDNEFRFPQELYPPATAQLASELLPLLPQADADEINHATRDFTTFGVFSPHGPATLKNNRFEQPDLWHYANLGAPPFVLARNWQVGAYVNDAANSAIEGNRFQVLHTGLLGLKAHHTTVVNNVFLECEYGVWVTAPNGAAVANTICINCNSFIRNSPLDLPTYTSGYAGLPALTWSGTQPTLGGLMYPIYVDHANALVIDEFRPLYQNLPNGELMGNLFFDVTTAEYLGPGLYDIGHQRAIVQNETTPLLAYKTYADKPGSVLLKPVQLLTTNTITPNIYHGARNLSVTQDANPVGPNYDCARLGYQQGLQHTLPRMGRVAGLSAPSNSPRYALAPNVPNPFGDVTTVAYQLDGLAQTARLDVRDLTGRVVRSLPLPTDAAHGSVMLSLPGQPAGVYVAQLVVGGAVRATRRVVLTTESGR